MGTGGISRGLAPLWSARATQDQQLWESASGLLGVTAGAVFGATLASVLGAVASPAMLLGVAGYPIGRLIGRRLYRSRGRKHRQLAVVHDVLERLESHRERELRKHRGENLARASPDTLTRIDELIMHLETTVIPRIELSRSGVEDEWLAANTSPRQMLSSGSERSTDRPEDRLTVLFLAAEPTDHERLALDSEVRAVKRKLQDAESKVPIELITEWSVTADDLERTLLLHQPHVLHISGHGTPEGILLNKDGGGSELLDHTALNRLLEVLKDNLQLLVVNTCASDTYARAVGDTIGCAIGMPPMFPSDAAAEFSATFYRALGFGRTVDSAFELGKAALERMGLSDTMIPRLHTCDGHRSGPGVLGP